MDQTELDRVGPFEKIEEYQGEKLPNGVFVALRSEPYAQNNDHVSIIKGSSRWLLNLAQFYLCVGYPHADRRTRGNTAEDRFRRMKFNHAVAEIARVSIQSALNLLPHRLGPLLTSRMNERVQFQTFDENERVVLLEIVRGGSWISQLAQKELLPPWVDMVGRITASAQRTVKDGIATVEFSVKGECSLEGSTLITAEQALATGTTAVDVTPEVFRRCKSQPTRMIFIAFNAAVPGILKIKEEFPDATILVVMLHGGINTDGYIIRPGCGDVGRMDAGIPDKF